MLDTAVYQGCYYAIAPFQEGNPSVVSFRRIMDDGRLAPVSERKSISAREFVEVLKSAKFRAPTELELIRALDQTVTSARFWQEPDFEDELVAIPEVTEALRPIAELIAESEYTSSWANPVERTEQWLPMRRVPVPAGGPQVLNEYRAWILDDESRSKQKFEEDPSYPSAGAWWSTPISWVPYTTRSVAGMGPLCLYLEEDGRGGAADAGAYRISDAARVFEIVEPGDWVELCRRYPLEVTNCRRNVWFETTGQLPSVWIIPDWAKVAEDYDGVHLTIGGYLTTSGEALPVEAGSLTLMAGSTPDATYCLSGLEAIATPLGPPTFWPEPRCP